VKRKLATIENSKCEDPKHHNMFDPAVQRIMQPRQIFPEKTNLNKRYLISPSIFFTSYFPTLNTCKHQTKRLFIKVSPTPMYSFSDFIEKNVWTVNILSFLI